MQTEECRIEKDNVTENVTLMLFPLDQWSTCLVLISWCYYIKLPLTSWLNTTEIYPLTVLEARSPKPRRQQHWYLLEAQMENLFLTSSLFCDGCWQSQHSLACNLVSACLPSHGLPCISVPNLPPLSLRRIPGIGFRVHPKSRIISSQDP